jgi:peptidoglycan/LPS O-acetylase OafA/YrhL
VILSYDIPCSAVGPSPPYGGCWAAGDRIINGRASCACELPGGVAAALRKELATLGVPDGWGSRTFTLLLPSTGLGAALCGAGASRTGLPMLSSLAVGTGGWVALCPGCSEDSGGAWLGISPESVSGEFIVGGHLSVQGSRLQ